MNILLATYNYYPYNWGGSEIYVSGLAKFLKAKGDNVNIIAAAPSKAFLDHPLFFENENLKAIQYTYDGITIIGVYFHHTSTTEIYSKYNSSWVNSWNNLLQEISIKWDILHIHANTPIIGRALIEAVKKYVLSSKIIASYHTPLSCAKDTLLMGNYFKDCMVTPAVNVCTACILSDKFGLPLKTVKPLSSLLPSLKNEIILTSLRIKYLVKENIQSFKGFDLLVDQWHVFSEQIKQILLLNKVDTSKIELLRHGVDEAFLKNNNLYTRKKTPLIFLYAGRFIKLKGFHILLNAWCRLKETNERTLWILGDSQGTDDEMKKLIKKASQRTDIIWLGKRQPEDVHGIMNQVHCTIIPSQCLEIGPLVFHEAIASGSDVIASDIGGCKELANIYSAKSSLFKTGNSRSLVQAILHFKFSCVELQTSLQIDNYNDVYKKYKKITGTHSASHKENEFVN